jgi:UDPglucose--hexose-1-phosphate uridylyltransferase
VPELRQDRFTKEWVILATERAKRGGEAKAKRVPKPLPQHDEKCPFCPGNEAMTPAAVLEIPQQDGCAWQVRVIPNKYAAVSRDGQPVRHVAGSHHSVDGVGIHDVIIESPDHSQTIATLRVSEVQTILESYKARCDAVSDDPRVAQVIIFKNHGAGSGTTLEHPHTQLIATPVISSHIRGRIYEALRYYDDFGVCIACAALEEELTEQTRVVLTTDHFVVVEPFASPVPYNTHIYPRRHMCSFGEISPPELGDLAGALKSVLERLYVGLDNPDFNYTIVTAPTDHSAAQYYHWYLSIIPRLTQLAGFELGSGMSINTLSPESAAEFLRNVRTVKGHGAG